MHCTVAVAAEARAIREVRRLDDERVALEPAARIAHPHLHAGACVRAAVERDHARLVDHLVADHDDAGRLDDLRAVAVDDGNDRADEPARQAAIVVREIGVRRAGKPRPRRARRSATRCCPAGVSSGSRPFGGSTTSDVARDGTSGARANGATR